MIDSHLILLIAALMLLIFSFVKDNSLALCAAIIIIGYETLKLRFWSESNELTHLSTDLVIIGFIAGATLFTKSWVRKTIITLMGCGLLFGVHSMIFTSPPPVAIASTQHEILVQFTDVDALESWITDNESQYEITYPLFQVKDNSFKLDEYILIKTPLDAIGTITDLENHSYIVDAELNDKVALSPIIGELSKIDKTAGSKLNDPDLDKQWMSKSLKLDDFHNYMSKHQIQAQNTSIIAILDTGVDGRHEDLSANYFSINKNYDDDERGHGTHCAGIAAAVTGNNIGIASLLPPDSPVKVSGIQVMNKFGLGTQKTIIDGIIEAADKGCTVISLSLSGPKSEKRDLAYEEAVKYANAQGSIVVAAAGNSSSDANDYVPAGTVGVITVAALDSQMGKATYSNDVSRLAMGLAAPGSDIYSTKPNDNYSSESGTSMAAPFVSGLIGLMKAYDSTLTTDDVYRILKKSATKKDKMIIVNPREAMQLLFKELDR